MNTQYSLQRIEIQLKKRLKYPYIWRNKQKNIWDNQTNFIYNILDFDELLNHFKQLPFRNESSDFLFNYMINRWFNFWSAQGVEQVFCSFSEVEKEQNKKHKHIDFYLHQIPFDLKTTVFPKSYPYSAKNAYIHPENLIEWFYKNQSQENRKHFANRLFLVLYKKNTEHWKLKAELIWLKGIIENYLHNFSANKLHSIINLENQEQNILSDIIWAIQ